MGDLAVLDLSGDHRRHYVAIGRSLLLPHRLAISVVGAHDAHIWVVAGIPGVLIALGFAHEATALCEIDYGTEGLGDRQHCHKETCGCLELAMG